MKENSTTGKFAELTKRELKVALLILDGKRTVDIAAELGIKTNTVSTFKKHIYYKVGVRSSIDLFKLSVAEGFISFPVSN